MKATGAVIFILGVAAVLGYDEAEECTAEVCLLENGCLCASATSPISTSETPQFVILTSDDSVTDYVFSNYFSPLVVGRTNPDSNPISGTVFVPHEYTDYSRVNDLYNSGFEIGVNSISKNALSSYWAEADIETLVQEFGGDRLLVSHFANIPIDSILGVRTPNLQINGNVSFEAYDQSNLTFDSSWPALSGSPLFPYTLDYLSTQQCSVGNCPNEAFPGLWVVPINNLISPAGTDCNALSGCATNGTVTEVYDWLVENFNRFYNGNRAPMTLLVNSAWFQLYPDTFEAAGQFLDYLSTLDDVYLVSASQVIEWMKNPVPVAEFTSAIADRSASCSSRVCPLSHGETEIRYMTSCVACPAVYPWVDNPLGEAT